MTLSFYTIIWTLSFSKSANKFRGKNKIKKGLFKHYSLCYIVYETRVFFV